MRKATFILWGLLGLAGTLRCGAQITGAITGSVVDVTSSLVKKATVVVKNLGTGAERQLVTDSGGRFTAEQLPVGSYEVTVTASGFKKAVRTGLELNVADRLGVCDVDNRACDCTSDLRATWKGTCQAKQSPEYKSLFFRATGITTYLKNGGRVEVAQQIAGHESSSGGSRSLADAVGRERDGQIGLKCTF